MRLIDSIMFWLQQLKEQRKRLNTIAAMNNRAAASKRKRIIRATIDEWKREEVRAKVRRAFAEVERDSL